MNLALAVLIALGSVFSPLAPGARVPVAVASVDAGTADDVVGQTVAGELSQSDFTRKGANAAPSPLALNSPAGVALDATNHRLFVADRGNSRVLIYNLSNSNTLTDRQADNVLGQADFRSGSANRGGTAAADTLSYPYVQALAYDAAGNRLFVADSGNHRVLVYDVSSITNGEAAVNVLGQANFTSNSINRGGTVAVNTLYSPWGLLYDPGGNRLFLVDKNNNRVLVYDVSSITDGEDAVTVLGQANFTSNGANRGGSLAQNTLANPTGLALDSSGNRLFVADYFNQRVLVYNTASMSNGDNATRVLGQADFTSGNANRGGSSNVAANTLWNPYAVAYDSSGNRLFVADTTNNRVVVYDTNPINNGEDAVAVLGQANFTSQGANRGGSVAANTVYNPYGMHYDATGSRLFVTDGINHRVLVYDVASITDGEDAVDLVGQLDPAGSAVFTKNSADYNQVNARGLSAPYFSALDTVNHRLFVADSSNNRVLVYSLSSNDALTDRQADNVLGQADLISGAVNRGGSVAANTLYGPLGLAYDSSVNRLFVADQANNRVLVYDVSSITDGENAVAVLGQANFTSASANRGLGVAANGLWSPAGLAYGSGERLFVADQINSRVLVYDVASITDGENAVAVLGQANLTSSGSNRGGSAAVNTLYSPFGLTYDSTGSRLFVADTNNNRALVHDVASITNGEDAVAVLGQADFTTASANRGGSAAANTLNSPYGVGYDSSRSRLFVADTNNNRALVHDVASITNGEDAVAVLGQADFTTASANRGGSAAANTLNNPSDSMYDSARKRLLVADRANQRVVIYGDTASSTTTLASAPNPSASGQSVTFTATVSGAAGTPTGTVTFKDGSTALGTANLSSGSANFSTSALSAGTHSVTAEYGGDANFSGSASSALSQVISTAFSAAAWPDTFVPYTLSDGSPIYDPARDENPSYADVSSGLDDGAGALPSVYTASDGANLFFRFRIRGNPGSPSQGGFESTAYSMAIAVNGAKVAVVGLDGKSPSTDYVYVTNADGSSVEQVYATPFTGSQAGARATSDGSGAYFVDIQVPISRITAMAPSVTASTPVQFFFGTSQAANLSVINKDFVPGSAVSFTNMAVSKLQGLTASSTTLASSPNPSNTGQEVTFTATVSGSGGTPTGSVTFKEGGTTLGTGTLSGGIATYKTAGLSQGSHSITADYGGDGNFGPSTSSALAQVVNQAKTGTSTAVESSLNPSALGQTVRFTATVSASTGTPSGVVTFKDGTATLGTATLAAGKASYTASGLAIGSHDITAEYGGDSAFGASTSGVLVQGVQEPRWRPVGSGLDGTVEAVALDSHGKLYAAGGFFIKAGGVTIKNVARWDGVGWSALDSGTDTRVSALAADASGNLYAGGEFFKAGDLRVNSVARWDGSKWSALGTGTNGLVKALVIDSSGNLYAGGSFTKAGGTEARNIAKWDGSKWSALGSGVNGTVVTDLAFDGSGNLYAAGALSIPGTTPWNARAEGVFKWDGQKWSPLGADTGINSLAVDASGNLYAGGWFLKMGGKDASRVAKWDGSSWSPLGSGLNSAVYDLAVDASGNLYAGGQFTTAGGKDALRVAKWDGTSWSALGAGFNSSVLDLAMDSTGNLYAGGIFKKSGSMDMKSVAVYGASVETTTTLTSTPNPSQYGQRITFTATVKAPVGTPVGHVRFGQSWGGQTSLLGRAALSGGRAVFDMDWDMPRGTHNVVAWYEGASAFLPSTSAPLAQVVEMSPVLGLEATAQSVSGPHPPETGKTSVYQITIRAYNPGSGDLINLMATAQAPSGVAVKSVGTDMTFSGQTVTWRYAGFQGEGEPSTLAMGETASSRFQVEVTPSAGQAGQNITLMSSAAGSGTDPLNNATLSASAGAVTVGPVAVAEGAITGTVTDILSQNGISRATVQVYDSANNLASTVTTGNDGTYTTSRLPAGQYRVVFSKPNHLEYVGKTEVLGGQTATMDAILVPLAGSLTGEVTDAATGRAIQGARVAVQDASGAYEAVDMSNPAGRFSFGNIPAGIQLTVSATHPDYTTGLESSAAPQEKYSTKSSTGKAYTVGLKLYPRPGGIFGKVTDKASGAALGGATVTVYDARNNLAGKTLTDSEGSYSLSNVPAGNYTVRFARDPQYQPASTSALVPPNEMVNRDQALAARAGAILGRVMDAATGTAIAGATVRLLSSLGLELATAVTNDKGEFEFPGILPDAYTLEASANRYLAGSSSRASVTLEAGSTLSRDLILTPSPGSISGRVTDARTGSAISGASVQVYDAGSNPAGRTTTGSAGSYSLSSVPAGSYNLLFGAASYQRGTGTATVGAGEAATVDGILQPKAGSIAGTVVDAANRQPISGATVILVDSSGVEQAQAVSDGNGRYNLPVSSAGTYTVLASHTDYLTGDGGQATLTLDAGGSGSRDLALAHKPGSISGQVTSATTGEAISSVKITAYDARMNLVGIATTGSTGIYTITNLAPGAYTISADGSPVGYLPAKGSADVGPGQARSVDLVLTAASGTLSGTVTNASTSEALVGLNVTLTYPDGSVVTARTSGTGDYVFTGVTAQVNLSVASQGMPPFYLEAAGSSATSSLNAGGSARVNLVLQPGRGRIGGTVTGPVGVVPGASIRLYDASQNLVSETNTNGDGIYTLSGLTPGTYTLLFSKMGYQGKSYSPKIEPGTTTTLDINGAGLSGSIQGIVKSSSSLKPLPQTTVNLSDSNGTVADTVLADGTGRYSFSSVAPGSYQVAAEHPDYTAGSGGKGPVLMSPGGSATQDLSLDPRPASISGRVSSATTGNALAGVRLTARDARGNLAGAVVTDDNGGYSVGGLLDGNYTLTADGTPQGYLLSTANASVKPAQAAVLNLALPPRAGSLSGTVTNAASGEPLRDTEVALTYPDGKEALARSNGAGEYVFTDVTAEVLLTVAASSTSFYEQIPTSSATGTAPAGGSATANLMLRPRPAAIIGYGKVDVMRS